MFCQGPLLCVVASILLCSGMTDRHVANITTGEISLVRNSSSQHFESRCVFLPGLPFAKRNHPNISHLHSTRCKMTAFPALYAQGKWIKNCDRSDTSYALDPIAYARIRPKAFPAALLRGRDLFHKTFACSDYHSLSHQKQIMHYYWQPSSCNLLAFDRVQQTLMLLRNKFLFVGDSVMWQTVSSLKYLTGMEPSYRRSFILVNHKTLRPMTTEEIQLCTKHPNQYLDPNSSCPSDQPYHRSIATLNWTKDLDKVDVLVFSVGHHWWKEDKNFSKFSAMAAQFTQFLSENFKGKAAILVSATWGHRYCNEYDSPITFIPLVNDTDDIFHWKRAMLVQEVFRVQIAKYMKSIEHMTTSRPKMYYLYMNHTSLRPEAHYKPGIDCLHFCQPGVVDTWVHMLFNLFYDIGL